MDMQFTETRSAPELSDPEISLSRTRSIVETALFENHRTFLQFLVRRLGDSDTAEDVLQQFYLRVLNRSSELKAAKSVVAWLYTVLRSVLVDHYRKEATRRQRDTEYALMLDLTEESWDVAEPPNWGCACLYKVLPNLRPEYSDVLRRVDLGEMPPRHVAMDLGVTANNVRVRLHRARQALKQALLEFCTDCAEAGFFECSFNDPTNSTASVKQHQVPAL